MLKQRDMVIAAGILIFLISNASIKIILYTLSRKKVPVKIPRQKKK